MPRASSGLKDADCGEWKQVLALLPFRAGGSLTTQCEQQAIRTKFWDILKLAVRGSVEFGKPRCGSVSPQH